jgi:putative PIN family toxin of toxin-antitoxin system
VRIVLDSSVLVAAHITRAGVCAELFEDVLMQHHLVISRFILDELARKLTDEFDFDQATVRRIIRFISAQSTEVKPATLPKNVCRDPQDIPVLGTAVSGEATLLITVDKDLLAIEEFAGISIVRPGEFWRRVG